MVLKTTQSKLSPFLALSLLVHIIFLCVRSQDTVLAPIRAPRNDAVCISLKNVTVEGSSHVLIERKVAPDRARLRDIKPLPPVVERVSRLPRIQTQSDPSFPTWMPAHTRVAPVLFYTGKKASGDSLAEETYFSRIRRLLEAAKRYPESARRGGIEGSVGIGFCINRQGYLARNAEVFRSSGSPPLDQAAIACVEKVGKFPPFPDTFKEDLLKIRVDLVFELRARSKITSHFDAPIHPACDCVARRLNSSLFALLASCHARASTPENVNLFLREP